jgi:hypothetical protein
MSSENKKRKTDKKLHWGRGGNFMKHIGKGIKRLDFFTASQRRLNNKIGTAMYDECMEIINKCNKKLNETE